jgi:lysozyme
MIKTFENYNEYLMIEKLELRPLFDQLKTSVNKKIVATLIVGSLLAILNPVQAINYIENNSELSSKDKKELVKVIPKYKDPTEMLLSADGWDFIRKHERFRDHGYNLGDGMITIGFGHAEPYKTSKYKLNQKISFDEAYRLHIQDVNIAADGIKRMFDEWKSKGIHIKITQNQYDVLVDMAYQMGVSSLRQTPFIQAIKHYDLQKAAKLLRSTGINPKFKKGHNKRRQIEWERFVSN